MELEQVTLQCNCFLFLFFVCLVFVFANALSIIFNEIGKPHDHLLQQVSLNFCYLFNLYLKPIVVCIIWTMHHIHSPCISVCVTEKT